MNTEKSHSRFWHNLKRLAPTVLLLSLFVVGILATADNISVSNFTHGGSPNNIKTNNNGTATNIPFNSNGSLRQLTVTNAGSQEYFVPTNTVAEFQNFIAAANSASQVGADITGLCISGSTGINFGGSAGLVGPCSVCVGNGGTLGGGETCCSGLGAQTVNTYSCPGTSFGDPVWTLNTNQCVKEWTSGRIAPVGYSGIPFYWSGYTNNQFNGDCQNGSGSYNRYITSVFGCSIEGCGSNSTPTIVYCNDIPSNNPGACLGDPNNDGYVDSKTFGTSPSSGCKYVETINATLASSTTTCEPYTYAWEYGGWGACSANCGGGTRTRTATCKRNDGVTVANGNCAGSPLTSSSCNSQPCSTTTLWQCTGSGWSGVGINCLEQPFDCADDGGWELNTQICCSDQTDASGPNGMCGLQGPV